MKKKNNTITYAKSFALKKLQEQHFNITPIGRNFLVNKKLVNIRGCNRDNRAVKKENLIGGWGALKPNKFDIFIFISFDKNFKNERFFVLTSKEVQGLPDDPKSGGGKNFDLSYLDENIEGIENEWDKIRK